MTREKIDWNLSYLTSEKNRKQIGNKLEEIKGKRGQIITWCLEVEELLEGILTNYFIKFDNKKIQFFEVEVMRDMKFGSKVRLFEKVLKKEEYDNARSQKIINQIDNIQQARNKVAHWRNLVFLQEGEVKLRKNQSLKNEMLSLTDDMLKELEENKEWVFQEVINFNQWLWKKEVKDLNDSLKKQFKNKKIREKEN